MVNKPFQSKLNPHLAEIRDLRKTSPPTTYKQIADLMKERHGLDVSYHSVWHFVKVRSRRRSTYRILEDGESNASSEIIKKIKSKSDSNPQPKPDNSKWNFPPLTNA